ncbi:MAG: ATP-binding cassette domain-containing protein [Candidatus Binatota bacterium]
MKKVPALDFRSVSYSSFDDKKILQSIDWTVQQGEHWAILGPNGSGKTTLLKIACGYIWPNDGGVVYRKGKELIDLGELRKSIGWVTSTLPSQIPPREKTLRTVVSGKFAQIGLWEEPAKRDYTQAGEYLDQMGCFHLISREFGTLSQGEQQKVLIARARMTKPYLIFLDEPCAGMDPGAREIFLSGLQKMGRQKKVPSLIYVTHHIEEILPLFKKTLVLKDGKTLDSGNSRRILKRDVLEKLYGVALSITKRKGRYWPIVK